jgi:hypothetical protein
MVWYGKCCDVMLEHLRRTEWFDGKSFSSLTYRSQVSRTLDWFSKTNTIMRHSVCVQKTQLQACSNCLLTKAM